MAKTAGRAAGATSVVLLTLAAGQFVMALDTTVMNTAIATVAKDLGTTVTGIQTAITLYTLVMASLMITGGKVGEIVGRKRAFTIGCAVYACGSLTTALSPNLTDAVVRLVAAGGPGRGADHAGDRRAGRVELRQARAPARLRAGRGRRCDRRRAGPADRRRVHDLRLVAVGVRRGGADRRGDPRVRAPRDRHAGRGGRQARPVRHPPVGAGPGPDRVRHPEVRDLGRRAAQARGPAMDRPVPGDLDAARRFRRLGAVPALGAPADRARRGRAARPQAAAQRPDALRGDRVPVHVPRPGGDVLRRAAVPVGGARAVGDRDRRAGAADVAGLLAVRRRGPEARAGRQPATGRQRRVRADVRGAGAADRAARHRRRAGDRHRPAARDRVRARRDGLAAGQRDRLRGPATSRAARSGACRTRAPSSARRSAPRSPARSSSPR